MNSRISILTFAAIVLAGITVFFSSCKEDKDDIEKTLVIGDEYAGGIILYLDGSDGGLVCAKIDQNSGNGIQWASNQNSDTDALGTSVGTGQANTTAIIADQGTSINYAARVCDELDLEGYTDWYLPSKDELNLMFKLSENSKGNFQDKVYWSSTEKSYGSGGESGQAWSQDFDSTVGNYGDQNFDGKDNEHRVRAVRTFVKEQ